MENTLGKDQTESSRAALQLLAVFTCLLGFVLDRLLSPVGGQIGHDYSYFLPRLIEGNRFLTAGGLAIPWYSPAFCAGVPFYANPQSIFYSPIQILSFLFGSWEGIRLSVFFGLVIGVLGTFLLSRRVFDLDVISASIAAILFGGNGFFAVRMETGHLTFISFCLVPCICFVLLSRSISRVLSCSILALLGAGIVYSGGYYIIFIAPLTVLFTVIFLKIRENFPGNRTCSFSFAEISIRGLFGLIGSLAISTSKISAVRYYMEHFPRAASFDSLGGFGPTLGTIFTQLFAFGAYRPVSWGIWEYDSSIPQIAVVGLLLFIASLVARRRQVVATINSRRGGAWVAALLVFVLVMLLVISGTTAELGKSLTFLRSLRINIRFSSVFILPLCLAAAIGFSKREAWANSARIVAVVGLCTALSMIAHFFMPPLTVVKVFNLEVARDYEKTPGTKEFPKHVVFLDTTLSGEIQALVTGGTLAHCYEPLLNSIWPTGKLTEGPIESRDASAAYNLLNPACLGFPEANSCVAGELIGRGDTMNLSALLERRPTHWKLPQIQQICNIVSLCAFIFAVSIVGIAVFRRRVFPQS
jgi:hypothetical protein